jgi:hypothetical protein
LNDMDQGHHALLTELHKCELHRNS